MNFFNNFAKQLSVWIIFVVIIIFMLQFYGWGKRQTPEKITFQEFRNLLADGDAKIDLEGIILEAGEKEGDGTVRGKYLEIDGKEGRSFYFDYTLGPAREFLEEQKISFEYEKYERNTLLMILANLIPFVILIMIIWFFAYRQMQGGGSKALSFGKSRAKMHHQGDSPPTTFEDVAGVDEAKEELQEIIEFLRDPNKFTRLGGKIPKGVLLMGPPGAGKTLLARAVAGEAKVPFFNISGSDFVEMFVGVGASRVRDLFQQGMKNAPCIIFIDEIDAVGRQRGAGLGGGHDEREQTLNQLLVEMDGFNANEGVILMAATNRPDVLDKALLRPGRFDRQIVVDNPDIHGRHGILKVHTRKVPLEEKVDLEVLARGTPGFSGADLANLVNEAALLAARKSQDQVEMQDFEEAKDKVLMGPERRSMFISEKEKVLTAFHEAGHALVGRLLPYSDPVHRVTIIPRGRALGVTMHLPTEDRHTYARSYLLNKITIAMGGRAAEELQFGEITNGAAQDIKQASELANHMVREWGMSESIGPIAFGDSEEIFLGRDFVRERICSEEVAAEIDREVRRILDGCYEQARRLLGENKDLLDKIAEALMEREVLDNKDLDELIPPERDKRAQASPTSESESLDQPVASSAE